MTAAEIINKIECLAPAEREHVASYLRSVGKTRPLTGRELTRLAGTLVDKTDPAEIHALKERIAAGFYGGRKHA